MKMPKKKTRRIEVIVKIQEKIRGGGGGLVGSGGRPGWI